MLQKSIRGGRLLRAVSLVEVVVVIGLIVVVAAITIPRLGGQDGAASDAAAQTNITTVLDAALDAHSRGGVVESGTLGLSSDEVRILTSKASSASSEEVSLSSVPESVGLAARGGQGTCWLVRRDYIPQASTSPTVYAYTDTGPCTAERALQVSVEGAQGLSWDRPLEVK